MPQAKDFVVEQNPLEKTAFTGKLNMERWANSS
jgi:hypothetical protein